MPNNEIHRPPHGKFKIQECIKIGHFDEAQKYCDENVEFYDQKIAGMQDLFLEAQMAKMGLKPTPENKLATAINQPKRRTPTSRVYGTEGKS